MLNNKQFSRKCIITKDREQIDGKTQLYAIHEFTSNGLAILEDAKGNLMNVPASNLRLVPPTSLIEEKLEEEIEKRNNTKLVKPNLY